MGTTRQQLSTGDCVEPGGGKLSGSIPLTVSVKLPVTPPPHVVAFYGVNPNVQGLRNLRSGAATVVVIIVMEVRPDQSIPFP